MQDFKVFNRDTGYWDIWNDKGRIFAIRGEPGRYIIRDTKENPGGPGIKSLHGFKTVDACMAYICSDLMWEK